MARQSETKKKSNPSVSETTIMEQRLDDTVSYKILAKQVLQVGEKLKEKNEYSQYAYMRTVT